MPEWIAQLPPEEQPVMLAAQALVDSGDAEWVE